MKVLVEKSKTGAHTIRTLDGGCSPAAVFKAFDIDLTTDKVYYRMGDDLIQVTIDAKDLTEFAKYMDNKDMLRMRVVRKSRQHNFVPRKRKMEDEVFSWQLLLGSLAAVLMLFQPLLALPLVAYALTTDGYRSWFRRLLVPNEKKKKAADYAKQEAQLKGAGFTDKKRNRALLKKHGGDVQKAINELV